MQELRLYLVWDMETETTEEDMVLDQLFQAAAEENDHDEHSNARPRKKEKNKKRKASSSTAESEDIILPSSMLRPVLIIHGQPEFS